MKFVIAAVALIAVASGVQSSLIAGVPGLGLGLSHHGHGISLEHGVSHHGHGISLEQGISHHVHGISLEHGVSHHGLGLAGQSLVQGPAVWGAGHVSHGHLPAAVNVIASPAHISLPSHVAVDPHAVSHGATYVAKNRGAIHTAPLPGHINSAASVNLAPAPGTW